MSVDSIVGIILALCAILIVVAAYTALRYIKLGRNSYPESAPLSHGIDALAMIHYDRPQHRMWIELLRDAGDITAPEWTELAQFLSEWSQSMWRERTQ